MDNFIELNNIFDDPTESDIVSTGYGTIQRPKTKTKTMLINASKILTIEHANPLNEKLFKITFDNGEFVLVEEDEETLFKKLKQNEQKNTEN